MSAPDGSWSLMQTAAASILAEAKAGPHVWWTYHGLCRFRDMPRYPSQTEMARILGIDRSQVSRSIATLQDLGIVGDLDGDGYQLKWLDPVNLREDPVQSNAHRRAVKRTAKPVQSNAQPCAPECTEPVQLSAQTLYIETVETRDTGDAGASEPDLSTKAARNRHYPKAGSGGRAPKSYPAEFDRFWLAYPRKNRNNKPGAYVEWRRIVVAEGMDVIAHLDAEAQAMGRKMGDRPYAPVGWLKGEDWRETMLAPTNGKPVAWSALTRNQRWTAEDRQSKTKHRGAATSDWWATLSPAEQREIMEVAQ